MTAAVLAAIVEGHGEVEAVPVLFRSLMRGAIVVKPVRVKRQQVVKDGELERYAQIAEASIVERGGNGAVVLLLDADDACAANQGPVLLARLQRALPHREVGCALAVREFESWLVAGDPDAPDVPDEGRGGKKWLERRHGRYVETVHQPKLTRLLDLELATRRSRSLRHLQSEINRIAAALRR